MEHEGDCAVDLSSDDIHHKPLLEKLYWFNLLL